MIVTFEQFDRLQWRLGQLEDRVRILESGSKPPAPKPPAPPAVTCEQYIAQQPKPAPQPIPNAAVIIVPELDLSKPMPCGQAI